MLQTSRILTLLTCPLAALLCAVAASAQDKPVRTSPTIIYGPVLTTPPAITASPFRMPVVIKDPSLYPMPLAQVNPDSYTIRWIVPPGTKTTTMLQDGDTVNITPQGTFIIPKLADPAPLPTAPPK